MSDQVPSVSTISPEYVTDTLPSEFLEAIGEIIVRWGRLQWQLSNLLIVGFDIPKDTGRALTIGMEIGVLCGTVRTLTFNDTWINDKELRGHIQCLADDIRAKSCDRNNYAHGVFGFDIDEPNSFARYLFSAKEHRISPSSEKVTLEQLKKHASEAKGLVDRTVDLTVKLKASIVRSTDAR